MIKGPEKTREPMDEDDILKAARENLKSSRSFQDDELRANWEAAYASYKGEIPKPSDAHDSTIVSTDVSDTIEWVLPAVLKPLIESPDVVRFDPVNPEDVEQADMESDYVHHVCMKECAGFIKLYVHVKDALTLKNAIFCTYWDEGYKHQKESYRDLTEVELADLLSPADGSEVRLLSSKVREVPLIDVHTGVPLTPQEASGGAPVPQGAPAPPAPVQQLYDVEIRRFWAQGRPVIENCVPEAFKIDFSHNSIDLSDVSFCGYTFRRNRSYLVGLGYDEDKIDQIPRGTASGWDNEVRWAREDVERSSNQFDDENLTRDPSQDLYEIHRCYMHLDVDGDGIAEHYLVILGGFNGQVLLDYYEVPENPFSASTPFIAGHKFYGYSIYDKLHNLAKHKTKVLRMLEDNLDQANNPYKKVVRGMATLNDVVTRQVGGIWRVDDINAVQEVPRQPIEQSAEQLLLYYDKMRSERSGTDPTRSPCSRTSPTRA